MISALGRLWSKPRGSLVDVLPALLYMGILFWMGLTPLASLPGPEFELKDKVWHLGAFGGLAVLVARAIAHFGRPRALAARDAALSSALLGGVLELLQGLTAYRSSDWADFVADALGAGLAYLMLRVLGAAGAPSAAGA